MPAHRRALHAYLSDDAHEQWHNVAVEWGVSVSALLEALAPVLSEHRHGRDDSTDRLSVVRTARSIDAERRRRSPAVSLSRQ